MHISRVIDAPQNRSRKDSDAPGIKLVHNLNYRLQYGLQSQNRFIYYGDRNTLHINLPIGFFLAWPGTTMLEEKKETNYQVQNFSNYKDLNDKLFTYKQSSFKKSFLMSGGINNLKIDKYDSEDFENYVHQLERSDSTYQALINLNESSPITLKADFSKIEPQNVNGTKIYNFFIGYSKKYVPIPYIIDNFIPKGFQYVSQTSPLINQKFIANFARFLKQGLMNLFLLQQYSQNKSILKHHTDVAVNEMVTEESEAVSPEDLEDLPFLDAFEDETETDTSDSIIAIQNNEKEWFSVNKTLPTVYNEDNISYLLSKTPPVSKYSKDSCNIYDLLTLKLVIPENVLWMWGKNQQEYSEYAHLLKGVMYTKIPIKIEKIKNK